MPAGAAGSPSTVLVTGASSGIGEALARCFARDGHRLVLVARRESRLHALAKLLHDEHGTRVDVLPADLARPGAAAALAASLRRRRCAIDVLVNNAGVLEQGRSSGWAPARPAGDRPQRLRPDRHARRLRARDGPARPWPRAQRRVDLGLRARAGPGDLRRQQGLRAVADRVAGRGTARHRRHRHRAVPGHHRDRDARPRGAGQRARRAAAGTRWSATCRRSRPRVTAPAWPARSSPCPASQPGGHRGRARRAEVAAAAHRRSRWGGACSEHRVRSGGASPAATGAPGTDAPLEHEESRMKPLSGLDALFLHLETPETPMHVGALHLLASPPGDATRVRRRGAPPPGGTPASLAGVHAPPGADALRSRQSGLGPRRRGRPPRARASREAACAGHASRSWKRRSRGCTRGYSSAIARSGAWYVIEGLASGELALYTKIHHATLDGAASVAFAHALLDVTPVPRAVPASEHSARGEHPGPGRLLGTVGQDHGRAGAARGAAQLPDLARVMTALVARSGSAPREPRRRRASFRFAPRTPLNGSIGRARAIATLSIPLAGSRPRRRPPPRDGQRRGARGGERRAAAPSRRPRRAARGADGRGGPGVAARGRQHRRDDARDDEPDEPRHRRRRTRSPACTRSMPARAGPSR